MAVLNGVEFRTRHNDYRLAKPSTHSKHYHRTEEVTYPPVPPSVLRQRTVRDQITEMKQYFRAFKEQDINIRDYRPYFRPLLCYLEGAWTTNVDSLDESFTSDRHHIDADSWLDLQEKIRYTSASGRKDNFENYAYLPTTVVEVRDGSAILAQWNYRVLCHPPDQDLPLNRLRVVDDLASRMSFKRTYRDHIYSRAARFQVNPFDEDSWSEGKERHGLLDELMEQVPGKDNYPGTIYDEAFGLPAYKLSAWRNGGQDYKINAGYYHRWFKVL